MPHVRRGTRLRDNGSAVGAMSGRTSETTSTDRDHRYY